MLVQAAEQRREEALQRAKLRAKLDASLDLRSQVQQGRARTQALQQRGTRMRGIIARQADALLEALHCLQVSCCDMPECCRACSMRRRTDSAPLLLAAQTSRYLPAH